jgi:peptide/nickel transport system substrate-binding protein
MSKGEVGTSRGRRGRYVALVAVVAVLAVLVAACGGSAPQGSGNGGGGGTTTQGTPVKGATVTFAEQAGDTPDYIFPLYSLAYWDEGNVNQFQYLMFRPLYWYGSAGASDQLALNPSLSLANAPVYSDGNKTVTIKLKHYMWSNGQPVTSRDVEFWINLLKANKTDYGPYAPGGFPDNLTSESYPNASTIVLHLNEAYNPTWFTNNELAEISPLPQHAWDKESATGKVGNYDTSTAGAKAVYKYLNGQAKDLSSYATNPLWQVVDGPFHLSAFTLEGQATLVPNSHYSGQVKPKIGKLVELPFTSDAAEYNAVLGGTVDYGYLPSTDLPQVSRVEQAGYKVDPWQFWGVNYLYLNYSDNLAGKEVSQLYVRQALQRLIDQSEDSKAIFGKYAHPTYGPVPTVPSSSYTSDAQTTDPYPYSISAAKSLLVANGWNVVRNGTSTCTRSGGCGAGIPKGSALSINLTYPAGVPEWQQLSQAWQSSASAVGVKINLTSAPTNQIGSMLEPCKPGAGSCWTAIEYGVGFYFAPGPFPDGSYPFDAGLIGNKPADLAKIHQLVENVRTDPSSTVLKQYAQYTSKVLPGLWIPMPDLQISLVKNTIGGATPQNPLSAITPEAWTVSK